MKSIKEALAEEVLAEEALADEALADEALADEALADEALAEVRGAHQSARRSQVSKSSWYSLSTPPPHHP